MPVRFPSPIPFWIGYLLLAATLAAPFAGECLAGIPAALCMGWWLRRRAARTGDIAAYEQAQWLTTTCWAGVFLCMLGLIALSALFYAIGNDDSAMGALTALEREMDSGNLSEEEKLLRLFRLEAIQFLLGGSALWWFLLAWPIKRLIHGALSLWRGVAPRLLPRALRLLAACAALAIQSLFFLSLFL